MQKSLSTQTGYTLLELLLYVTIVGSLLTAVTLFYGMMQETRIRNQSVAEVNQQGVAAMEYITQTIRNANTVTAPTIGTTATSATFTVPTSSVSPTVFSITGTTLQVQEGSAAAIPLTSSAVQVSGLTIKNLSRANTDGVLQVSFTVTRTNVANRAEYTYQKTFTSSAAIR